MNQQLEFVKAGLQQKDLYQLSKIAEKHIPEFALPICEEALDRADRYESLAYWLAWGMEILSDRHREILSRFFKKGVAVKRFNLQIDGRSTKPLKRMGYIVGDYTNGWNITAYGVTVFHVENIRRETEAKLRRKIAKELETKS